MDKRRLLDAILATLRAELEVVRASASAAAEGATHEDARAENEYDTRGLEQSYLAGAQAARATALEASLARLATMSVAPLERVALGAYVEIEDGEERARYYLLPEHGGTSVESEGGRVVVITPESPVARALLGRSEGDLVEVPRRGRRAEVEVMRVA